jgi:hypothetical protein
LTLDAIIAPHKIPVADPIKSGTPRRRVTMKTISLTARATRAIAVSLDRRKTPASALVAFRDLVLSAKPGFRANREKNAFSMKKTCAEAANPMPLARILLTP